MSIEKHITVVIFDKLIHIKRNFVGKNTKLKNIDYTNIDLYQYLKINA